MSRRQKYPANGPTSFNTVIRIPYRKVPRRRSKFTLWYSALKAQEIKGIVREPRVSEPPDTSYLYESKTIRNHKAKKKSL